MTDFVKRYLDAMADRRLAPVRKRSDRKIQVLRPSTNMVLEKFTLGVYSLYAYELFKEQLLLSLGYSCVQTSPSFFVSLSEGEQRKDISFDATTISFDCPCKFFPRMGILCRHVIRCLWQLNYNIIPLQYILDRWRWNIAVPASTDHSLTTEPSRSTFTPIVLPAPVRVPQEVLLQNPQITATKGRP